LYIDGERNAHMYQINPSVCFNIFKKPSKVAGVYQWMLQSIFGVPYRGNSTLRR